MRGFHKLVMLGVLLVTLLLIIDTIDAGKKQGKKKDIETGRSYEQENPKIASKNKRTSSIKQDKVKKTESQRSTNFEEENEYVSKSSRFESKKTDIKKNIKFAPKEKRFSDEIPKSSKHFQKPKKSKFIEEEPVEKLDYSKSKGKKIKPQYVRSENVDKVVKTVKKTTQKKLVDENENVENILSEELNRLKNEETISIEETIGGNPKKRKYKLVEVVLQEDGQQEEEQEGNETSLEQGSEDQEFFDVLNEEVTERTKSTQNPKSYKSKKSPKKSNIVEEDQKEETASEDSYFNNTEETAESDFSEGTTSEVKSFSSKYQDPTLESCQGLPEDPNRQGPKKLTLYVVEEEIDGQIRKRVVSEEDGVTMCEVADLLKETYNMAIPEE